MRGQSQRQSLLKEIRADAVCQTLHSALREQEEALGRHQRELVTNAEAAMNARFRTLKALQDDVGLSASELAGIGMSREEARAEGGVAAAR